MLTTCDSQQLLKYFWKAGLLDINFAALEKKNKPQSALYVCSIHGTDKHYNSNSARAKCSAACKSWVWPDLVYYMASVCREAGADLAYAVGMQQQDRKDRYRQTELQALNSTCWMTLKDCLIPHQKSFPHMSHCQPIFFFKKHNKSSYKLKEV